MRRAILLFAVASLALLPAARAGADSSDSSPLRFDVDIELDVALGFWSGTVDGDLEGTYRWDPTALPVIVGNAWHYQGEFTICTGEGCIEGTQEGVYNLKPGKKGWSYRANGWVTEAPPYYAHLIGYKNHEKGVTTNPFDPSGIIHGEGSAFLAKAHGG